MAKPRTPLLAADCAVFDAKGRVLLIRRGNPPFKGCFALPGGFVEVGETVEAASRRELEEETGIKVRTLQLVGVYSDPQRDPRGHTCSVVFLLRPRRNSGRCGADAAPETCGHATCRQATLKREQIAWLTSTAR